MISFPRLTSFLLAVTCCLSFSLAAQKTNFQDQYVTVNGADVHYQLAGTGPVTVVFESGHSSDLRAWNAIFDRVASFAKVFRYDRPGYGKSAPAKHPENFYEIAIHLHNTLEAAGLRRPYVLVGHSMGGVIVRALAALYPDDVVGIMMIDPLTEYFGSELSAEEKENVVASLDLQMKTDSIYMGSEGPRHMAEWRITRREYLLGFPEIKAFGPLPEVPVTLFGAGNFVLIDGIRRLHATKLTSHPEARYIEIANAPHDIQSFDAPLVIESIRRMVFPNADKVLAYTLAKKGIDACIAQYMAMKKDYPEEYVTARSLDNLGYMQLRTGNTQNAIRLFALNVKYYPKNSSAYDSLGEGYMVAGDYKSAIRHYKKSLALNPANTNAVEMLNKMHVQMKAR